MSDTDKKRRINCNSENRALITRVHHFLQEEYNFLKNSHPDHDDIKLLSDIRQRTSEATGISKSIVSNILDKENTSGSTSKCLNTTMKHRRKKDIEFELDNINLNVIRNTIQNFHKQYRSRPTLTKLRSVLREKIDFDGSLETLHSLLLKMGYKWRKLSNNRRVLQEKHELQLWRLKYLNKINEYRAEGRLIVYTDETTVQTSHVGQFKDSPFVNSFGAGSRVIVVHAGSKNGFVPKASLILKVPSKSFDCHTDLSFDTYSKWLMEMLLPNLPQGAVIVMDNAPYHNARINKIPLSYAKKNEMTEWLTDNGIEWYESMKKIELYDLIKRNKERFLSFKIDDMVKSKGFEILRLPPSHPELNATGKIWDILKDVIASSNIGPKTKTLEHLITHILNGIEKSVWRDACTHIEKIEKEYMEHFDVDFELNIDLETDEETNDFDYNSDYTDE